MGSLVLGPELTSDRLAAAAGSGGPSETSEQIVLVGKLRRARIRAFAVPNGGSRRKGEGARLKLAGVEEGVSDLLIVDPPPGGDYGVALEMKRASGSWKDVTEAQRGWLEAFDRLGWTAVVGYGWRDAAEKLRRIGYVLALLIGLGGTGEASACPTYQERDLGALVGSEGLSFELTLAGWLADVDPLFLAAVTYTESRWLGTRNGDGGNSVGLWQMTGTAIRSLNRAMTRQEARELASIPYVRSFVAGLYWARLIRRYGRRFAASVYTCGPRCRGVTSTGTSRAYYRHFRRLKGEL